MQLMISATLGLAVAGFIGMEANSYVSVENTQGKTEAMPNCPRALELPGKESKYNKFASMSRLTLSTEGLGEKKAWSKTLCAISLDTGTYAP